jgi:hypothetical protein
VRSTDFDRIERFDCDLLGMRIGPRPALAVPVRRFCVSEQAVLHMLPCKAWPAAGAGGPFDQFALDADDLRAH